MPITQLPARNHVWCVREARAEAALEEAHRDKMSGLAPQNKLAFHARICDYVAALAKLRAATAWAKAGGVSQAEIDSWSDG